MKMREIHLTKPLTDPEERRRFEIVYGETKAFAQLADDVLEELGASRSQGIPAGDAIEALGPAVAARIFARPRPLLLDSCSYLLLVAALLDTDGRLTEDGWILSPAVLPNGREEFGLRLLRESTIREAGDRTRPLAYVLLRSRLDARGSRRFIIAQWTFYSMPPETHGKFALVPTAPDRTATITADDWKDDMPALDGFDDGAQPPIPPHGLN